MNEPELIMPPPSRRFLLASLWTPCAALASMHPGVFLLLKARAKALKSTPEPRPGLKPEPEGGTHFVDV